ncbi:Triple functional domain protein [Manis javanica]|nr:Triple functional domain protein [Manis javanica]
MATSAGGRRAPHSCRRRWAEEAAGCRRSRGERGRSAPGVGTGGPGPHSPPPGVSPHAPRRPPGRATWEATYSWCRAICPETSVSISALFGTSR